MSNLYQYHNQWMSRPDDERYVGDGTTYGALREMLEDMEDFRASAREVITPDQGFRAIEDEGAVKVVGKGNVAYSPTHYAFGQLAALAEAPPSYLRRLPAPLAVQCLNTGLDSYHNNTQLLLSKKSNVIAAFTGENYGRIWNDDVIRGVTDFVGNNSDWSIPGVFGKKVKVNKDTTTLFASDHDFFIFLADEENRVKFGNRRKGEDDKGLARGFFVRNSMVGDCKFTVSMFLFDYACSNRIVWGAECYEEISIRHSKTAPDRWIGQAQGLLESYRNSSVTPLENALAEACVAKLEDKRVVEILAPLVGVRSVEKVKAQHMEEEHRPMETLWDTVTGLTAYAKNVPFQDERVKLEREAGKLLSHFLPKQKLLEAAPKPQIVVPIMDF